MRNVSHEGSYSNYTFSLLQSFDAVLAALDRGECVDLSRLPPPLSGRE